MEQKVEELGRLRPVKVATADAPSEPVLRSLAARADVIVNGGAIPRAARVTADGRLTRSGHGSERVMPLVRDAVTVVADGDEFPG
jgi:hypothetical protein